MIIPDKLIQLIISGDCILFLGSGATREAGGPVGRELSELLTHKFQKTDISTNDLRTFVDILASDIDREDIDKTIIEILLKIRPSKAHLMLPNFCWQAIFTTNYDRLIELAYDTFFQLQNAHPLQDHNVVLKAQDQSPLINRSIVSLYKLHGCISAISHGNPLVLTSGDYRSTQKKRGRMIKSLKSLVHEYAIVFMGFSFTDQYLLDMLEEIEEESPYHSRRKMYLVNPKLSESEQKFFKTKNIEHIPFTFGKFFEILMEHVNHEDRKKALQSSLPTVRNITGETVTLPPKLKISLESQLEILTPRGHPKENPREFLTGSPASLGDLRNRNDILRDQEHKLAVEVEKKLNSDDYIRPMIVILGPGGTGKSTLATRIAYNFAEAGKAVSLCLKNPDLWKIQDIVAFAKIVCSPLIFVADGVEVRSWLHKIKDLRNELSIARVNAILLLSCQKAVWNEHQLKVGDQTVTVFNLDEQLSKNEASSLVNNMVKAKLLKTLSQKEKEKQISHIINDCEGHLIVALLELVHNGKFRDIVLKEYNNVSDRAQKAYQYVALLHQHRLSIPDSLLNAVSTRDWNLFIDEVIRQEAELVIIQEMDASHRRLWFRSRHPLIAKVIIDVVVPKHEDRVRMYRKIFKELGTSSDDRAFILTLLTTESIRNEIREDKYMAEFFAQALDLFPNDMDLILQFGRYENSAKNFDRAKEILEWGKSLNPRNSYILHQLGVCAQRRLNIEQDEILQDALIQEARSYFLQVQEINPTSRYGYVSEISLALGIARRTNDKEEKLNLFSEAEDTIRRGMDLVREADLVFLKGSRAELANCAGSPEEVIVQIEEIDAHDKIRYGSLYHLWASCLIKLNKENPAIQVINKGLDKFPGDERLNYLMLELLENLLYKSESRRLATELVEGCRDAENVKVFTFFIRAVIQVYNSQYVPSKSTFREIRSKLGYHASTRIRILWLDEEGKAISSQGKISYRKNERPWVKNVETGSTLPMDNYNYWEKLGKPNNIKFNTGFSFAGPRAVVTK